MVDLPDPLGPMIANPGHVIKGVKILGIPFFTRNDPPIRETGSENATVSQRDGRMNMPLPITSMRLASRLGTRELKSAPEVCR
jgi:hypothetical protein